MKYSDNDNISIVAIDESRWMASCEIKLQEGQRISLSLALPAQRDLSLGQIQRALLDQAVQELQFLLM